MTKALYPYTLKPVALNMSEAEFRAAQLSLFEKSRVGRSIKYKKIDKNLIIQPNLKITFNNVFKRVKI